MNKNVNTKEHENILNKFKPKKLSKNPKGEGEDYFACSSENNLENYKELKKKSGLRKESNEFLAAREQNN